jgi:hypothetical protein
MDKIEICQKVKKTIRRIIVQDESRVLSIGSGVVIKPDGTLITAKHVIEDEKIGVYRGHICVKGLESEEFEYLPVITGLKVDINLPEYIDPINIDLTILKPTKKLENIDFLPLCKDLAQVGTDIIMGGFPDDIEFPLSFLEKINENNPEMIKVKEAFNKKFKYYFRQLMCKQAMIGNLQKINLKCDVGSLRIKDLTNINVLGATYWLDNHLTYGGSGGSVVNMSGELLGIICRKALTNFKRDELTGSLEKIPSGTGMALSHQLISWLIND